MSFSSIHRGICVRLGYFGPPPADGEAATVQPRLGRADEAHDDRAEMTERRAVERPLDERIDISVDIK